MGGATTLIFSFIYLEESEIQMSYNPATEDEEIPFESKCHNTQFELTVQLLVQQQLYDYSCGGQ